MTEPRTVDEVEAFDPSSLQDGLLRHVTDVHERLARAREQGPVMLSNPFVETTSPNLKPADVTVLGYREAQEALSLGLVNNVVADALGHTQEIAAKLARGPAVAQSLIKRALSQGHELPLERVLDLEATYQTIAARQPDFAEGVAAFNEKRPARFGSVPS